MKGKADRYERLSDKSTIAYMYEAMTMDITSSTTDAEISALLDGYDKDAKSGGYALALDALKTAMIEMRDDLARDV